MEEPRDAGRRAIVLSLVLGVPLSVVLLWLALRDVELGKVWSSVQDADPGLLALAVCAIAIVYSLQAERWRRIAATPDVPWRRFLEMVVSGVACNNVLPGRLGDLLRARWLGVDGHLVGAQASRQRTSVRSTRRPSSAVSFLPSSRVRARYEIGTS